MPDANNGYPSGKSIASSDNSLPQDSAQTPVIQTDDTHFEHSDKASHAEKPKDALSKTVIPDSVTKQGDEALPLTTEIHEPNDPVSTAVIEQQPVFSRNQALPMSFHVMTGATRSVVEKMIIDDGGGTIVPRSRASILVDPTKDKPNEFEIWVSPDGSRAMVPLGWVMECLAANRLVDLKEYAARDI